MQFLATVFVIVNLFGQLGGCVMVMGRLKVEIACGLLFFIVCLQVCILGKCDSIQRKLTFLFTMFTDCSLLNSLGYSIFTSEFGAYWRIAISFS